MILATALTIVNGLTLCLVAAVTWYAFKFGDADSQRGGIFLSSVLAFNIVAAWLA